MVCGNFILPEICKLCLFLCSIQFAQLIVPYLPCPKLKYPPLCGEIIIVYLKPRDSRVVFVVQQASSRMRDEACFEKMQLEFDDYLHYIKRMFVCEFKSIGILIKRISLADKFIGIDLAVIQ